MTNDLEQTTALPDLFPLINKLEENINGVVLGKPKAVRLCLVALMAGEHVLLEDVPGVGKTLVGKAIANSVHGEFCRLQFTPDLLPSDIIGSSVFNAKSGEFSYNKGPIFSNIVLADEINRAPPRTQSALLEAMSDGQVSVDGSTHSLPAPFMVIATQNPFEYEGTYVLPESQLDRFLMRVSMGYPAREFEREVLRTHRTGEPVDDLDACVSLEQITQLQHAIRTVEFEPTIIEYLLNVVEATRHTEELSVGVSTRGALLWYRASQAMAAVMGREYVVPDDVKQLAVPVLSHRVLARGMVQGAQRSAVEAIIERIVGELPVPT